jgi:hypothetical protein
MCSIWLVVLVAANRYWAVCRPHTVAAVWTSRRTLIYVVTAIAFVLVFNMPRMFEYSIVVGQSPLQQQPEHPDNSVTTGGNYTLSVGAHYYDVIDSRAPLAAAAESFDAIRNNESMSGYHGMTAHEEVTPFGKHYSYRVVYKVLFVNILLVLLPVATLIVLSAFIVRALRRTPSYRLAQVSKQRHSVNGSAVCVSPKQQRHNDVVVENVTAADGICRRQPPVDGANVDQQPSGRLQYVKRQSKTARRIKV